MTDQPTNYRKLFWRSRQHLWLALLTLGLGFASGEPLGLLAGGVFYALGLIYLPDSAWFRRSADTKRAAAERAEADARLAAFQQQRTQLLDQLSSARRTRYQQLAAVCADIEAASADAHATSVTLSLETRLRRLDELMWTFLRLLSIEQALDVYLETERREQLPQSVEAATRDVADLDAELAASAKNSSPALETRRKLLQSRRDRLDALRQRLTRVEQARANVELARSEQERLVEQVKLIRADAVAHKNAESLTARIDLSVEHLAETNQWLAQLAEFKDLTAQLPPPSVRVGYTPAATPRKSRTESTETT
ncbi:MAG TPA: hypothetical protein VGD81_04380 [Opitutaceae bacterium]